MPSRPSNEIRLAYKIAISMATLHTMAFAVVQLLSLPNPANDFAGLTIYIPMIVFDWIGLPVFQSSGGWGWSSPSGFGIVMAIIFWLGVWLCIGYLVERVARR